MISETGAAIRSIKAAMDIAKGVSALKSETDINLAVIEIQRVLLDAQSSALEDKEKISKLQEVIRDLRVKIDGFEEWENLQKRYALTESPSGSFTYDLKAGAGVDEPFHRLCPVCFDQRRKSVLQTLAKQNGGEIVECHVCKTRLEISEIRYPPIQTRSDSF
jgi:hypothetical protein